jgi:hypothetical protein
VPPGSGGNVGSRVSASGSCGVFFFRLGAILGAKTSPLRTSSSEPNRGGAFQAQGGLFSSYAGGSSWASFGITWLFLLWQNLNKICSLYRQARCCAAIPRRSPIRGAVGSSHPAMGGWSAWRRQLLAELLACLFPLRATSHTAAQIHTHTQIPDPDPHCHMAHGLLATRTPRPDRVWPNAHLPRSAGGGRPSGTDTKRVADQRHRHGPCGRCSLHAR